MWGSVQFSSVQSLSRFWLFVTPWTAARQTSLSITNSRSLLKLMSIGLVMPLVVLFYLTLWMKNDQWRRAIKITFSCQGKSQWWSWCTNATSIKIKKILKDRKIYISHAPCKFKYDKQKKTLAQCQYHR